MSCSRSTKKSGGEPRFFLLETSEDIKELFSDIWCVINKFEAEKDKWLSEIFGWVVERPQGATDSSTRKKIIMRLRFVAFCTLVFHSNILFGNYEPYEDIINDIIGEKASFACKRELKDEKFKNNPTIAAWVARLEHLQVAEEFKINNFSIPRLQASIDALGQEEKERFLLAWGESIGDLIERVNQIGTTIFDWESQHLHKVIPSSVGIAVVANSPAEFKAMASTSAIHVDSSIQKTLLVYYKIGQSSYHITFMSSHDYVAYRKFINPTQKGNKLSPVPKSPVPKSPCPPTDLFADSSKAGSDQHDLDDKSEAEIRKSSTSAHTNLKTHDSMPSKVRISHLNLTYFFITYAHNFFSSYLYPCNNFFILNFHFYLGC
jgi:hypothetical protein